MKMLHQVVIVIWFGSYIINKYGTTNLKADISNFLYTIEGYRIDINKK